MRTSKVTARNQLPHHFAEARVPALYYGAGSLSALPEIMNDLGVVGPVLLVTGNSAFEPHGFGPRLVSLLEEHGARVFSRRVHGEPSPRLVDQVVAEAQEAFGGEPGAVVAVGGGSVIDTAKAASAGFRHAGSIKEYLEGVGTKKPSGSRVPLVAASTTAGTGSEGTKNAVLSEVGREGYKKSLRHDAFVPDAAILDPELHRSAPASVTAASGLDAITQLLEAYVSVKATPFTDVFCEMGLTQAAWAYPRVLSDPEDLEARGSMAMAAYLSGLSLATAGLGLVHGAASPLGAARDIPHGVVCGTLIGEVSRRSVSFLFGAKSGDQGPGVVSAAEGADLERGRHKYANAGRLLTGRYDASEEEAAGELVAWLGDITELSGVSRLGEYGFTREELESLAAKCGDKNQPVSFDSDATAAVLRERL